MTNHPNRSRRKDAPPKPQAIRSARERAGLSVADAAKLIYKSEKGWRKWEAGERAMDPAYWELWQIKVKEQQ